MNLFENFERKSDNVLPRKKFIRRIVIFAFIAIMLEVVTILIGSVGFHIIEGMNWLNSSLNAAMIVSGNGPPIEAQSQGGKVFQIIYSMFGVVMFVMVISAILVPVFHRMLHSFHFNPENEKSK